MNTPHKFKIILYVSVICIFMWIMFYHKYYIYYDYNYVLCNLLDIIKIQHSRNTVLIKRSLSSHPSASCSDRRSGCRLTSSLEGEQHLGRSTPTMCKVPARPVGESIHHGQRTHCPLSKISEAVLWPESCWWSLQGWGSSLASFPSSPQRPCSQISSSLEGPLPNYQGDIWRHLSHCPSWQQMSAWTDAIAISKCNHLKPCYIPAEQTNIKPHFIHTLAWNLTRVRRWIRCVCDPHAISLYPLLLHTSCKIYKYIYFLVALPTHWLKKGVSTASFLLDRQCTIKMTIHHQTLISFITVLLM